MSIPFFASMDIPQDLGQTPPGFDSEPVPISSYHDSEPEPISSYQETEPVPISSYQEKDDFWENGFNVENTTENKDPSPVKDHNNGKDDHSSFTPGRTDLNQLPAIPPVSSGQGLPYAPVDFPNPGDVWSWRVGRRVSGAGFHVDRFLVLPEKLQQRNVPKSFASKPALARYLQGQFPDMDVDAFFASFSWKIPALFEPAAKVDAASLFEETPKDGSKDESKKEENPQEEKKEGNSRYSQRKRKPVQTQTYEPPEEKPKVTPRGGSRKKKEKAAASTPSTTSQPSTKQKSRQAPRRTTRQRGGAVDLNFLNEEAEAGGGSSAGKRKKRRGEFEDEEVSIPHIYVSPMNGVLAVSHSPVEINPEEFDSYLSSLDNLLTQPPEDGQASAIAVSDTSPMREYEWAEARMKLSSLLEKDFPSLFYSKEASEIASLATKLRKDPSLSAEEIVKLKLIEEIPTFSEVFQENKGVIEEADRFFSALELNKAKVASLKFEYSELKDKLGNIQSEVDSNSETIRQIDEQIAHLQARRAELTKLISNKNKEKIDLNYAQKMVANSIPKVVQEVQAANSKKPDWELKKENGLKREAEILNKFAPLKGFYL